MNGYSLEESSFFNTLSDHDGRATPLMRSTTTTYGRHTIRLSFLASASLIFALLSLTCSDLGDITGDPFIRSYSGKLLPSTGQIKALVVFVQFKDHATSDPDWPVDSLPNWASDFIGSSAEQGGNYAPGGLSDRIYRFSNSKLHVVGDIYPTPVITELPSDQYADFGEVNLEIVRTIDKDVNFAQYDQLNSGGSYVRQGSDRIVDLVMIVYRGVPAAFSPVFHWGTADLGFGDYYSDDDRFIMGHLGSGLAIAYQPKSGAVTPFDDAVGLAIHEVGHFFFEPGHIIENFAGLGAMSNENGGSSFNSIERRLLGWSDFMYVNSDSAILTLRDFFTTKDAAAVRIVSSEREWFIIENRQKIDPLDKAKYPGIYVYYFNGAFNYGLDIVSADGRWDWTLNAANQEAEKTTENPAFGTSKLQKTRFGTDLRRPPGYSGDSLDAFYFGHKTRVSPRINPASFTRRGSYTGVQIDLMSFSNGVYTVKVVRNKP